MNVLTLLGVLLSCLMGLGLLSPAKAQAHLLGPEVLGASRVEALAENPAINKTGANKTGANETVAVATFAGGCFWCMEHPFDELDGVIMTTSGYTGGDYVNPTYAQVSSGTTGHVEAMQITYDPRRVSYEQLLTVFWRNVDPLDERGQFCDRGSQYRSAVFYHDEQQQQLAETTKQSVSERFEQPVATEILPATDFYAAEDYHQNYYQIHPVRYRVYRFGCGRDQRLAELWGSTEDSVAGIAAP